MKLIYKYLTLCLVAVMNLMACTSEAANQSLKIYTEADTAITVSAAAPDFIVKLKANPTTGYNWTMQSSDDQLVKMTKHEYQAPKKGLIGAGGFDVWQFTASPAMFSGGKQVKLNFSYARNWEKVAPAKTLEFTVSG